MFKLCKSASIKLHRILSLSSGASLYERTLCNKILSNKHNNSSLSFTSPILEKAVKMTDSKDFILRNDQPIVELDCNEAFSGLTENEKLYAHYLSQAGWAGGLIVLVQTSPESPLIFSLLHRIFVAQTIESLSSAATTAGVTDDEFKAFLVYSCGIFTNSGNYKSFGDSKFVPNLPSESFFKIISASKAYDNNKDIITNLWTGVNTALYSLNSRLKSLGLGEKGVTTYFSSNCDESDAALVNEWLASKHLEAYICRTFKTVNNGGTAVYNIRLAAVEDSDKEGITISDEEFKSCIFKVTRGDYSKLLQIVIDNLDIAKRHTTNDREVEMLDHYINSFREGSLKEHKDGSRVWIKNKGPVIETYIGFIETYRDPSGQRGEFEAFVAMVNREMSAKFQRLVDNAESFLVLLPWGKDFEMDNFLRPDFTSLDVLTFSGSGIPAGINIPNYDEIRTNEGFKNVSLGNVIPASYKTTVSVFLSPEDQQLLKKYAVQSFEVQVGLHELLGHGSGKLLRVDADGKYNFDKDKVRSPLDDSPITSWYGPGETYDSIFTSMGSSMEECRAESVGLLLSLEAKVLEIFGFTGQEADDVIYVNWLNLIWAGTAKALEMYNPETKVWLQSHSQARFAITNMLLETAPELLKIEETEPGEQLLITLDRAQLQTAGREAMRKFLLQLQFYKATADVKKAKELFDKYSAVPYEGSAPWGKWRDIIMAKREPRKMFVQGNTELNDKMEVVLKTYSSSPEGLIQSVVERFPSTTIDDVLEELWAKDYKYFPDYNVV